MRRTLESLAAGNEDRQRVLKNRRLRQKSRSRIVLCPTCLVTSYSNRDKNDACGSCLADMWNGQDIIRGDRDRRTGENLINCAMTMTAHRLPYPDLSQSRDRPIPTSAGFARPDGWERGGTSDAGRTMQKLFCELATALSRVLPGDPNAPLAPLISGASYESDNAYLRLPVEAVRALDDLWHLMAWQDTTAYEIGLEKGQRLLSQLALGELTHDMFAKAIADQTRACRRAREQDEKGVKRR